MKKALLIAALAVTFTHTQGFASLLELSKWNTAIPASSDNEKHIHVVITSADGCKFEIDGEYTFFTGHFSGTVTVSGKGNCPNRVFHFDFTIPASQGDILYESGETEAEFNSLFSEPQLRSDIAQAIVNA